MGGDSPKLLLTKHRVQPHFIPTVCTTIFCAGQHTSLVVLFEQEKSQIPEGGKQTRLRNPLFIELSQSKTKAADRHSIFKLISSNREQSN